MDELLLGIDIGTQSSKAVLAAPDGRLVATARRPHRTRFPQPGRAEHDAEEIWWADVRALCAELLTPATRDAVAGVCVSGIGPCLLPCGPDLEPLRTAILYGIDTRATAEIAELEERYGAEAILARGGSALSTQAIGPKLLWLQRREPEVWARAAGWYMASSFVAARLTGEYVLDHHSASQSDPLYDLGRRDWAADWAEELSAGVPLPRLVWPTEVVGEVHAAGAAATGLAAGTPVVAGTIDAWAEARSVGVRSPGDTMLMYGSTLFIVGVTTEPVIHPNLWSTADLRPETTCIAAGMASSGTVTEWFRELVGQPIETLVEEAGAAAPGADGLVALPYFAGERSPIFDPEARGVIAGLTLSHTRGHLARALYEGVAFGVRHNLEEIAAAGAELHRFVAVGGGATGGFWPQLVSDIAGIEQIVPEQTIGAAYGDALLAAVGVGLVEADADWTVEHARLRPDPALRETYDRAYGIYRALYPATSELCHDLARSQVGR
jgi:xylulokinase